MQHLPISILHVVAALTIFLCVSVALTYAIRNNFVRTRLIMTLFFFFIVFTLSVSFWDVAPFTYPFAVPAVIVGVLIGQFFGVRAARDKLRTQGIEYYMEHVGHIHFSEIRRLDWWTVINFYSVTGGLVMINLVGLSTVIFRGTLLGAIATSAVGAFLIGTIIPYLAHLWSLQPLRYK